MLYVIEEKSLESYDINCFAVALRLRIETLQRAGETPEGRLGALRNTLSNWLVDNNKADERAAIRAEKKKTEEGCILKTFLSLRECLNKGENFIICTVCSVICFSEWQTCSTFIASLRHL